MSINNMVLFSPKRLAVFLPLAAGCLALSASPSQAGLLVRIFDDPVSGTDLKITVHGKLNSLPLPSIENPAPPDLFSCGFDGYITDVSICTGPGSLSNLTLYDVTSTQTSLPIPLFNSIIGADEWSPIHTFALFALDNLFPQNVIGINSDYMLGSFFASSSTFKNHSLSSLGLAPGYVGTWTLDGIDEEIVVVAGVPGPLPLFGAASAFGFSRRLRQRIRSPRIG
ncbi:MAG: hypothetical protein ACK550_15975 [Synechococcaceae cyanobacterium]